MPIKSTEAKARKAEYLREYKRTHTPVGKTVKSTFSDEEYKRLATYAKTCGETAAKSARRLALSALDNRPSLSKADEDKVDAFVHVVRGIANNLNQMARYSNTMRAMLNEREVGYQLQYLEEVFRKFLEGGSNRE
jgi:hypothetical protein